MKKYNIKIQNRTNAMRFLSDRKEILYSIFTISEYIMFYFPINRNDIKFFIEISNNITILDNFK